MKREIIQIMPAQGWVAVYECRTGKAIQEELAGFALVVDEMSGARVMGIISSGDERGLGLTKEVNLLGITHKSDHDRLAYWDKLCAKNPLKRGETNGSS